MTTQQWLRLLLLGAIWGGSFFFVRIAVGETGPLTLVLLRVAIAASALHLYLLVRGTSLRPALGFAGSLLILSILNNAIPFSLIAAGQTQIGAGLASVLNSTTPFWTIVIANAVTADEKVTANKVAGILLGIAGTAAMILPSASGVAGGPTWAKLALVGASASYAVAAIFAKRFRGLPPAVVATSQLTGSTLVMLPLVILVDGTGGVMAATMPAWLAVLALALLSTAFAYILFFGLIASAGATNTTLVTLIVPVSAILLGALLLGERLEAYEIGGMVLIGLGLVIIDGRLLRRRP